MLLQFIKSFIAESVIESIIGDTNIRLEVCYTSGRKVLNASDSNYSYGSLHRVFRQVFRRLHIVRRKLKEVLILGFGAGSVLHILQNEHHLTFNTTGVEIDQKVIDLARKHFHLDRFKNLKIKIEDAGEFMSQNHALFDLIVIDPYLNNRVPPQFEKPDFLLQVKKALKAGGLAIFNKFVFDSSTEQEASDLVRNFERFPGKTRVIDIKQKFVNRMIILENNG